MKTKPAQSAASDPSLQTSSGPVAVVGAGVVGGAILENCLASGWSVWLADADPLALQRGASRVASRFPHVAIEPADSPLPGLAALTFRGAEDPPAPTAVVPELLIESIPEKLELKQVFFQAARQAWGQDCILATNTSNLSVAEIFAPLQNDSNALGMHFFMPVPERPLVELIPLASTSAATLLRCQQLAAGLGKDSLVVADRPGFVVNRLLAPYLNQALLLLGRGAEATELDRATREFGMPMSPLELIDRIGIRTAFDTGRVFWRAFPRRIDPAPILPGMLKAGRLGAAAGGGFFAGSVSVDEPLGTDHLHPAAEAVIRRYTRETRVWDREALRVALAVPMWLETAELLSEGVVPSLDQVELAVRGGLGFRGGFCRFFDTLGSDFLAAVIRGAEGEPALAAPPELIDLLGTERTPSESLLAYARGKQGQAAITAPTRHR